jgi:ferric-dicitrate binding protein FerR (iron transport regulator)
MDFKENKGWQVWEGQHPNENPKLLKQIWEASGSYKDGYQPDVEKGLGAFKNRMGTQETGRIVRLAPFKIALRIAAGVVLLLVAGLFLKNKLSGAGETMVAATQVAATQTLALSDGSNVLLNQSSQLVYQSGFSKKKRSVALEGEAFFKIQRDEARPFVIETEIATVTVLGTSFNVRSYPKEEIFEVFVETGKVKVDFKKEDQHIELTPGQFVRLNNANGELVRGTDGAGILSAWRTGVISFKGHSLPNIFEGMERLYGVDFDLKTSQSSDCLHTLTVQKGKLEEAIEALKTSCPQLKFVKDANGYKIKGACCN